MDQSRERGRGHRPHYHARGRGGGYRGGYHQGGRGGGRGPLPGGHQLSYVGHKRGRDDGDGAKDEKRALIMLLMDLGNKPPGAPEDQQALDMGALDEAVKACKREISNKNDTITELLLDCAVELSPKIPLYALLIGLINVDEPHWCGDLIDTAASMLAACLTSAQPADHDRARLLLRLLCCLMATHVLQPLGCAALLEAMVASASAAVSEDAHRLAWQPWSDWMVYCVVATLPWAGSELSAACPAELARLSEAVDAYLEKRPLSFSEELRPFRAEIKEGDQAVKNDSGGASYLADLWAAVKECAATADWRVESIPQLLNEEPGGSQYSSRLAIGQTHTLPSVQVPEAPSGLPSTAEGQPHPLQVAVAVQQAYPHHGGIRLLEPQHTDAGRPAIDRFVAEDYIIDTLASFDADRTQCVKRLVSGLMLPYNYTNLLSEVLFGQMLALPQPRLPSMAYCTVIVDLCRLPRLALPKPLSGCVRECFLRVPVMDPELRGRLLTWLSYHLSNLDNKWPWERWVRYVEEPEDNPYRQFCKELVARLVRLSWWDRVMQVLPPEFQRLLGPMPQVPLLPGQEGPQQQQPQPQQQQQQQQPQGAGGQQGGVQGVSHVAGSAGAGEQQEGEGGGAGAEGMDQDGEGQGQGLGHEEQQGGGERGVQGGGGDAEMEEGGGGGGEGAPAAPGAPAAAEAVPQPLPSVDAVLAGELLRDVIRAKAGPAALLEWMGTRGVEAALGEGPLGPVKVLMRSLLAAGSKSPTHLNVALERYAASLKELLGRAGLSGQITTVELAAQFYTALPQKVLMVLDRLLALGLVESEAVAHWAFDTAIPTTLSEQASASSAWEVLNYALERAAARLPEAEEKIGKTLGDLELVHKKIHAQQEWANTLAGRLRAHAQSRRQEQGDGEGSTRDVEGVPLDELAVDDRSTKLLAGHRDAMLSLSKLSAKVEALNGMMAQHKALRETAGPSRDTTMLAAYRGFLQLLAAEEERAAAHRMETEGEAQETGNRAGEIHQARLDSLYAQLRAFVRKFLPQTAAIAPQLAKEMQDHAPPPQATEIMQEVLKCKL